MKYNLKGHKRLNNALVAKFLHRHLTTNLDKNFYECKHNADANFNHKMKYDLQGNIKITKDIE